MNIISKYKVLFLGVLSLSAASCSDFLDKLPDERVEITTEDQTIKMLSTAYSTGNYGWLAELSSDNLIDINAPFEATQSDGEKIRTYYNLSYYKRADEEAFKFEPVKSDTDSDSPTSIWDGCYNAIATANQVIEFLDGIQAKTGELTEKMKAAYGEAYLIRAYHHFILVNLFCQAYRSPELSKQDIGIPYMTTVEKNLEATYDRGNVADVYAKIEEDLEKGLPLVSDVIYDKPKWHFNEKAAHAFAARFYLFERKYDKVIEHANKVLGEDRTALASTLFSAAGFDDCTSGKDYAEIWQGPQEPNNLLLIGTYSTQWRRSVGCRYAYAGDALAAIEFHLGPNWLYYMMPCVGAMGGTFWDGTSDHGYASAKIYERFEYTDKVAGIGYCHIIRREFTCNELLLERAEAYLMKGDQTNCAEDLMAYDRSRFSLSDKTWKSLSNDNKSLWPLTLEDMEKFYTRPGDWHGLPKYNVLENWDFTQNMSPDYVISQDKVMLMNAINDMRRYETAYTGHRFFDLKRWGMEYSHTFGNSDHQETVTLKYNDPRRALEIPQEVISAGLSTSQPLITSDAASQAVGMNFSGLMNHK